MKRNNKDLYENIMHNISKQVKKTLNENRPGDGSWADRVFKDLENRMDYRTETKYNSAFSLLKQLINYINKYNEEQDKIESLVSYLVKEMNISIDNGNDEKAEAIYTKLLKLTDLMKELNLVKLSSNINSNYIYNNIINNYKR